MRRKFGRSRIGCSGWEYKHWRGLFYPEELPRSRWFAHYARTFDTVEINNSFYRLPAESTVIGWRKEAPRGFLYAWKGSRYLTHMRKLKEPEDPLARLFERARELKEHLGPVLYQLPPRWAPNLERLERFVKALPRDVRQAIEFRDPAWYSTETLKLLAAHGVALCLHDMAGSESARVAAGRFIYVRFHGPGPKYSGGYPRSALRDWAQWLGAEMRKGRDVYAYFNNDVGGHAPRDAVTLRELL